MIEKDTAVFITDKTALVALGGSGAYTWAEFSWLFDRAFLSFVSDSLIKEHQPKIKMSCDNPQIPSEWLRGQHHLFTYHEWVTLCQKFIRRVRPPTGDDGFSDFRRDCLQKSKDVLVELIDQITGLYRLFDQEVFVVLSSKQPHWVVKEDGASSIESMKNQYNSVVSEVNDLLQQIREENASDPNTPE